MLSIALLYILRSKSREARTVSDWRKSMRIYYRSAQVMHILAIESFQFLLQIYIFAAELIVLTMLYVTIRNLFPITFIALLSGGMALACLMCMKLAFGCASKINDSSRTMYKDVEKTTKEQKAVLRSFKPMVIRVGDTFTITSASFPNILDYILSNLVNLLVTFK